MRKEEELLNRRILNVTMATASQDKARVEGRVQLFVVDVIRRTFQ